MPSIKELEDAFVKADDLSRSSQATPEQRAQALDDARAFSVELKRQRGLQGTDVNVPRGEFEYAIEKAPKKPATVGDLAREMGTTMTLGTLGQALGGPFDEGGARVGGAAGTGLANLLNQFQRMADNPDEEFKWGELASDTALGWAGAGPTLSAARAAVASPAAREISKEAIRQGLVGLTAGNVRKMVDRGEPQTLGENIVSFALPAGGGAASQYTLSRPAVTLATEMPTVRSRTLEGGRSLGLKTMPSETMPTAEVQQLEKIAGPAALRQKIQLFNAPKIKEAMNKYLGLGENADVTIPVLKGIRDEEAVPYQMAGKIAEKARSELETLEQQLAREPDITAREVARAEPAMARRIADLTLRTKADPEELKVAKAEMDFAFQNWRNSGDPKVLAEARQLRDKYETMAVDFEKAVASAGDPTLAQRLTKARERIAKTYNAEEALNLGDAGYDPKVLLSILNRGIPLSGEAEKIAKFTAAFGRDVAEQSAVGTSGGGMLSGFWGPLMTGTETLIATRNPILAGLASVAPAAAKELATKRLLSEGFQKRAAGSIAPRVFLDPKAAIGAAAMRYGGQVAGKQAATTRSVTQADIEDLRDNPDLAEEFDAKFGAGQAQKYLARKRP